MHVSANATIFSLNFWYIHMLYWIKILFWDNFCSLQSLPSSERHIPSNPQRRMGAVGTTAGHHSTTRNILWITCKSLHFLMLRGRRPAVVGVLCASRGDYFRANYKGLARRQTKDLLFNFMWKVNKLPVHKTLKASLWLCMGCAQTVHGCARAVPVTH